MLFRSWSSTPNSPRSRQPLDWPRLHRQADESYRAYCNNNDLGMDNRTWNRELRQQLLQRRNTGSDEAFLRTLQRNQEWVDLELLLRALTEFGARPLLLSMPIHGGWYDQCGITYAGRKVYYQRLRELGARHHAAVVDFADHDADRTFCRDNIGHLTPSGFVYYSQVLDGFFHDVIPRQSELPVPASLSKKGTEGVHDEALIEPSGKR